MCTFIPKYRHTPSFDAQILVKKVRLSLGWLRYISSTSFENVKDHYVFFSAQTTHLFIYFSWAQCVGLCQSKGYEPPESIAWNERLSSNEENSSAMRKPSFASDMWSLGCVLVEVFTGKKLFSVFVPSWSQKVCNSTHPLFLFERSIFGVWLKMAVENLIISFVWTIGYPSCFLLSIIWHQDINDVVDELVTKRERDRSFLGVFVAFKELLLR